MQLDSSFEADLRESLLDEAERQLVGKRDNIVFQAIQQSQEVLDTAGSELDWNVEPIKQSLGTPEVERGRASITVTWGWGHEAAPYWEYGTSRHTIRGDPILSFIWSDAPPGVREMFPSTEREDGDPRVFFQSVQHPGTPALRFVREGLRWLRSSEGLRS
jgi:hypothetical protein